MNVDEKKSYTKLINSSIIDDNNNLIRLTYNPVESWSTKNHYYYLENKLEYLNNTNEWYYDDTNSYLYVRLRNDQSPDNTEIRAKVQTYSIDLRASRSVIQKLNFFGTTLKVTNADRITIKDCDFVYPSCYAHMLGEINRVQK